MKLKKDYMLRKAAGTYVMVATGAEAAHFHGMLRLNACAAMLAEMLTLGATEAQLLARLTGEYRVDADTAQKDLREFLERLAQGGFLENTQ